MKPKRTNHVAQMRAEYDFDYSEAVRGKYYKRLLAEGSNVVVLERDVAKAFPNSAAVNKALRSVLQAKRRRLRRVQHGRAQKLRAPVSVDVRAQMRSTPRFVLAVVATIPCAKVLGVTIQRSLLARADQIIE